MTAPYSTMLRIVLLAAVAALFGCQFPLTRTPSAGRVVLNLSYTQPSESRNASRLLLPTAKTITLLVTLGTTEISKADYPIVGNTASAVLSLEPYKVYTLEAWAYDEGTPPVLRFHGTGSVELKTLAESAQLLLFPVAEGTLSTPWTVVSAAGQPLGSPGMGSFSGLAAQASTTQIFDFGSTGTAFTLAPDNTGAELYLQNDSGIRFTPQTPGTIVPADLGTGTRFWATWYLPENAAGPVGLSPVGTFTIPVSSLTLSGPTTLLQRASVPAVLTLAPLNATNQAPADLEWASDAPSVVAVNASGQLTAIGKGTAKVTVKTKANPLVAAGLTITVTGGTKPGLKLWNNGPWVSGPPALPATVAVTGTPTGLAALTGTGEVWLTAANGAEWSLLSPDAPAGARWIAEQSGVLTAATTAAVYQRNVSGQWTVLMPGPAGGIQGLCASGGSWITAGADGFLYTWVNDTWEKGPGLPPNFQFLAGNATDVIVGDGTSFFVLENTLWNAGGSLPLDTEALGLAWDTLVAFVMEQ